MKTNVQKLAGGLPQFIDGVTIDAALIAGAVNRRYFSGFSSSAGVVLITREQSYLLVDFRYFEAAKKKVQGLEVILFQNREETIIELLKKHAVSGVLLEQEEVSFKEANFLKNIIDDAGAIAVLDDTLDQLIRKMRMIKSPDELKKMKQAQKVTEEAFSYILPQIKPGVTEKELALSIEFFIRKQGAEAVAFDLIVVSGKNSSLPHGVPSDKPIELGDFITIDIGAVVEGYHSDMTRTVAIGKINEEQKRIYEIVLDAQLKGIQKVKAGVTCSLIDQTVREHIYSLGYEGCFGHSTGHSLGMKIHERPAFSTSDHTILRPGMVMTVEPGIYLNDRFGVRIEDMIVITENGCENLTNASKELIIL